MNKKYWTLFKTGDSELRALERTKYDKEFTLPIIELTRGRKSRKDQVGDIAKRIEKLKKIFSANTICLDLTTTQDLTNKQIDQLYNYNEGYKEWIEFLKIQRNNFKEIIPSILVDIEDEDLYENLQKQVESLCKHFKKIVYRNSIADDGCYEDIDIIAPIIKEKNRTLYFVIDTEYVPTGAYKSVIEKVKIRIKKIRKIAEGVKIVIVSTSFPKYVSDIGNDYKDIFPLNEIDIYNGVSEGEKEIEYGDYCSINPIRNDGVIMARGWIPRIDVPTQTQIYYYRKRRGEDSYSDTYIEVAEEVVQDPLYPKKLSENWGIRQINLCADGNSPGASPSFWISVRMSIHIEQQIRRLKKLQYRD
ncbi:hypothetical protein [uncultured Draconibacterium sp.]|uniref:beta family protein n=1 Tax=uncultured Draconibacterium sp. TaxID=1573823 RepID=UPI0032168368